LAVTVWRIAALKRLSAWVRLGDLFGPLTDGGRRTGRSAVR
jgi:hypothetical protein